MNIEWRSQEGYGDFITGLGYAHSSTIKFKQPIHINFHWPNPKDHLLSEKDTESILYRFNYIKSRMREVDGLTIEHTFSSTPPWRFINELEEFNPLHGLWYPKEELITEKGLVVVWSSRHNLTFPGYHKDPVYDWWDMVMNKLTIDGYNVKEITYRTPVSEAMDWMERCEFGVGYEGMIHQLFKFLWKPTVIASQRIGLSRLLAIQGHIVTDYKPLLYGDIQTLVNKSRENILRIKIEHQRYLDDYYNPHEHKLYNKPT